MVNKSILKLVGAIIFIAVFSLILWTQIEKRFFVQPDCEIDVREYQTKIDELNVSLGQALEIMESNSKLIDTLEAKAAVKAVLLETKIKEIKNLERKRITLKRENEILLSQTIKHINVSPTYLDSLRRKHFGG